MPKRTLLLCLATAGLASPQDWPQWGQNPQHTGTVGVTGQSARRILVDQVVDPFVPDQIVQNSGDVLAHYQAPLVEGRNVYMLLKAGQWMPGAWEKQIWQERKYRWEKGSLVPQWTFPTDWKPVPDAGVIGWEPVFHPVLTNHGLYVPGSAGTVYRLNRHTGKVRARLNPWGDDLNPLRFVVSPLTADAAGNIYYTVLQLAASDPWGLRGTDVPDSWLVKIALDGTATKVSFKGLIADAPQTCRATFTRQQLPWPPSPDAVPGTLPCLSQRPGINAAPAVASDGTIYVVTAAHSQGARRYSYLVALNPDLSLRWAASLRGRLRDGCGVLLPIGGPGGCRQGTPANGVDPATNEAPAGQVIDTSTASPVIAPDGSILYGAYTRYNYARGHLFRFSAQGDFLASYDFGWDSTPAIRTHDGTFSVYLKDNNYSVGSYCGDPNVCPAKANGPYTLNELTADLKPVWRFQNTNTQDCSRDPSGAVVCQPADPGGFEWCINAPAVDVAGNVYANSEDGNLYIIGPDGNLKSQLFMDAALGAAYTPLSIGPDGKIYTQNAGRLFVVGN